MKIDMKIKIVEKPACLHKFLGWIGTVFEWAVLSLVICFFFDKKAESVDANAHILFCGSMVVHIVILSVHSYWMRKHGHLKHFFYIWGYHIFNKIITYLILCFLLTHLNNWFLFLILLIALTILTISKVFFILYSFFTCFCCRSPNIQHLQYYFYILDFFFSKDSFIQTSRMFKTLYFFVCIPIGALALGISVTNQCESISFVLAILCFLPFCIFVCIEFTDLCKKQKVSFMIIMVYLLFSWFFLSFPLLFFNHFGKEDGILYSLISFGIYLLLHIVVYYYNWKTSKKNERNTQVFTCMIISNIFIQLVSYLGFAFAALSFNVEEGKVIGAFTLVFLILLNIRKIKVFLECIIGYANEEGENKVWSWENRKDKIFSSLNLWVNKEEFLKQVSASHAEILLFGTLILILILSQAPLSELFEKDCLTIISICVYLLPILSCFGIMLKKDLSFHQKYFSNAFLYLFLFIFLPIYFFQDSDSGIHFLAFVIFAIFLLCDVAIFLQNCHELKCLIISILDLLGKILSFLSVCLEVFRFSNSTHSPYFLILKIPLFILANLNHLNLFRYSGLMIFGCSKPETKDLIYRISVVNGQSVKRKKREFIAACIFRVLSWALSIVELSLGYSGNLFGIWFTIIIVGFLVEGIIIPFLILGFLCRCMCAFTEACCKTENDRKEWAECCCEFIQCLIPE